MKINICKKRTLPVIFMKTSSEIFTNEIPVHKCL